MCGSNRWWPIPPPGNGEGHHSSCVSNPRIITSQAMPFPRIITCCCCPDPGDYHPVMYAHPKGYHWIFMPDPRNITIFHAKKSDSPGGGMVNDRFEPHITIGGEVNPKYFGLAVQNVVRPCTWWNKAVFFILQPLNPPVHGVWRFGVEKGEKVVYSGYKWCKIWISITFQPSKCIMFHVIASYTPKICVFFTFFTSKPSAPMYRGVKELQYEKNGLIPSCTWSYPILSR